MLWRFLFLLQHLSLLISFVIFNSVNLFCNFKFLTFHHQIMAITDEINFQFILFFNFYMTSIKLYMFTLLRLIRLTSSWKDPCGSMGQESSTYYILVHNLILITVMLGFLFWRKYVMYFFNTRNKWSIKQLNCVKYTQQFEITQNLSVNIL
jgi:hypothetical protein